METHDVILSRRSIRQFRREPVGRAILEKMVDAARLAPSAANLQPLEYIVVDDEEKCRSVFPCLRWAAYISPKGSPNPGNEPAAYIVVLVNTQVRSQGYEYDVGAAVENMILTAWAEGIGSCWLISIDREKLSELLNVSEGYRVDSVLALGYPAEEPIVEEFQDSVKYWKDDSGLLHVPKRSLKSIIHYNKLSGTEK